MSPRTLLYVVLNALAIVACGAAGAGAGYGLIRTVDLGGVGGAIVAAMIGMVVATAAWTLGSVLLRAAGLVR